MRRESGMTTESLSSRVLRNENEVRYDHGEFFVRGSQK